MPTTPGGLPYPAPADSPDGPYSFQQLAEAVEAELVTIQSGLEPVPAVAAAGGIGDLFITFPVALPSAGYAVSLTPSFQCRMVSFGIVARTTTQLQVRVNNYSSVASTAGYLYWTATLHP